MRYSQRRSLTLKERFEARVVRGDGDSCWTLKRRRRRTDATAAPERPRLGLGRQGEGWVYAYRFAWEIENGPIPDGLEVCHRCDNPQCVRVSHLFLGTFIENMEDKVRKGRQQRGDGHARARLTAEAAREIRASEESLGVLASRFGVAISTVCDVRRGRTWAAA